MNGASVFSWLSPSGGLVYHARALRYGESRWAPFRESVGDWLLTWAGAHSPSLTLVGPSAGYALTDAFLARFKHITVFEPDPIARALLGRRLARLSVAVEWQTEDLLIAPLAAGREGLGGWLRQRSTQPVLFCNVLGQVRFLLSGTSFERWQSEFQIQASKRNVLQPWASFHDRVSGGLVPLSSAPWGTRGAAWSDEQIIELYSAGLAARGQPARRHELLDHGTASLFPAEWCRAYFHFSLTPKTHHLVEGVHSGGDLRR